MEDKPYTFFETEGALMGFLERIQPTNSKKRKYEEIDKMSEFLLKKNVNLTDTQMEAVFEGIEEKRMVGLCQITGKLKYMKQYIKRSAIASLTLIHKLLTRSHQKELYIEEFCIFDATMYEDMKLDRHFIAPYNNSNSVNIAFEVIQVLKQKRQYLPLKQFIKNDEALMKIEGILMNSNKDLNDQEAAPTIDDIVSSTHPKTWAEVDLEEDKNMFNDILSEPMLENRELDLDFMSTFWDPLLSPNKSHLSGSTLLSSKINTTKEIIGKIHIQSEEFNCTKFLEVVHSNSSGKSLRKGQMLISEDIKKEGGVEKQLVVDNIHQFAFSKRILDDAYSNLVAKNSATSLNSHTAKIEDNLNAMHLKMNLYLKPIKEKLIEMEELNKATEILENFRILFEINDQITSHFHQHNIEKIVEAYKSYETVIEKYKDIPFFNQFLDKVELLVRKAKNIIIQNIMEDEKLTFEKLDDSLKHITSLKNASEIIIELVGQRRKRIYGCIENIHESISTQKNPNLIKSYNAKSGKHPISSRSSGNIINKLQNPQISETQRLKETLQDSNPIDIFLAIKQKREENEGYENLLKETGDSKSTEIIIQGFQRSLIEFNEFFIREIKMLDKILSLYGSKERGSILNLNKMLTEIILFLGSKWSEIFLSKNIGATGRNSNMDLNTISQITNISNFHRPFFTEEHSKCLIICLTSVGQSLSHIFPINIQRSLSDIKVEFLKAYLNQVFIQVQREMENIDYYSYSLIPSFTNFDRPLFISQFMNLMFESTDSFGEFIATGEFTQILETNDFLEIFAIPFQNLILHLLFILTQKSIEIYRANNRSDLYNDTPKLYLMYIEGLNNLMENILEDISERLTSHFTRKKNGDKRILISTDTRIKKTQTEIGLHYIKHRSQSLSILISALFTNNVQETNSLHNNAHIQIIREENEGEGEYREYREYVGHMGHMGHKDNQEEIFEVKGKNNELGGNQLYDWFLVHKYPGENIRSVAVEIVKYFIYIQNEIYEYLQQSTLYFFPKLIHQFFTYINDQIPKSNINDHRFATQLCIDVEFIILYLKDFATEEENSIIKRVHQFLIKKLRQLEENTAAHRSQNISSLNRSGGARGEVAGSLQGSLSTDSSQVRQKKLAVFKYKMDALFWYNK